ncbi:MAG TPA: GPW/gp25 family protein [Rhabdochlamydiaceae bacterium]|nr:GPW/gp25 family protein [Rhabdochlamydiaceae bacterium]
MGLLNKFRKEGQKKSLEQEVADSLMSLFNTKQSFGAWQKGLGLQTYCSSKSRNDVIAEIVSDIKYNIDCFEKRIKLIDIQVIENKSISNLKLQINCHLGGRFHSFYVGFRQSQNPIQVEVEV